MLPLLSVFKIHRLHWLIHWFYVGNKYHLTMGAGMPQVSPELQGRLQELARLIIFFTLNNRTIKNKSSFEMKK